MASFPERMTDETFDRAWEYTAKGFCRAKRRFAMEVPISWATNVLFFCGAVFVSLGVMIEEVPAASAYIRSFPMVAQWWETYRMWLYGLELEPRQMQMLTAALVYLIAFASAIPITLAVRLVYHPKKPYMPEGARREKAWVLLDTARRASAYTKRATHNARMFFAVLYALVMYVFIGFVLFGSAYHGAALVETDMSTSTMIGLIILAAALTYAVLATVLGMLTAPLYYFRFSGKALAEAERYWKSVREAEETARGQEETTEKTVNHEACF